MGVYIPNMEKPKNTFNCSVKINPEERRCIYTGKVFEETLSLLIDRPCGDCPLIEIDDDLIRMIKENAIIIRAINDRLKKKISKSDELKKELMGTNTNLVMFDEPNTDQHRPTHPKR